MSRLNHRLIIVLLGMLLIFSMAQKADKQPQDRTVDVMKDEGQLRNRLQYSKSPYLLQHADNPVDWYEWGDEAFEKAAREDKPIFLSIGYSTCHWCHVMEQESFEDEEVARLMNETFVSIKVDREERPDIDQVYMTVCRMTGSNCGWPLNVIMTPDKQPFLVATYIPREERFGRPGMKELIPAIKDYWLNKRAEVNETAEKITAVLAGNSSGDSGATLDATILDTAYSQLKASYDPDHGGFGTRPKFPRPHDLLFLLRHWHMNRDGEALAMVEKTLQEMRKGGVFDHIGYGFHRYSTDAGWFLPHFEKMLYDQAMLTIAYIEAYQATGKDEYARVAREILTYIMREMTDESGGFYSAEDADSEGEEGKFYLWTIDEIRTVLGPDDAELFNKIFNITAEGTYYEEATQEPKGTNIPYLKSFDDELARQIGLATLDLKRRIEEMRKQLFRAREKRIHPGKDDKILTDWNGLMIAAMARAAQVLDEEKYARTAADAAAFILSALRTEDGRLLHRFRRGDAGIEAFADDYAFMIWGLLELYDATFEPRYLRTALELNEILLKYYWDDENGGLFFTSADGEQLLVRKKEVYDGAVPSANSVALSNFLRLGRITGDSSFEKKANSLVKAFAETIGQHPAAFTQFMCGLQFNYGSTFEVVVVGNRKADDTQAMIRSLRRAYLPNKVTLFKPTNGEEEEIVKLVPVIDNQTALMGKATAYVCRNFVCSLPTTDIDKMMELLGKN